MNMIYKADLHTHSTASDGQYTPAELAVLVKKRGAEVWALTDHDSVAGAGEAKRAGEALGLRVVQGVELSADDYLNLHILGYGFSMPALQKWFDSLQGGRNDRKYRIRDFLRTKGLEIPLDEVDEEAAGGSVGRPHFAKVMLRHGMVTTPRPGVRGVDQGRRWDGFSGSPLSDCVGDREGGPRRAGAAACGLWLGRGRVLLSNSYFGADGGIPGHRGEIWPTRHRRQRLSQREKQTGSPAGSVGLGTRLAAVREEMYRLEKNRLVLSKWTLMRPSLMRSLVRKM